jgi:hypothetical protein
MAALIWVYLITPSSRNRRQAGFRMVGLDTRQRACDPPPGGVDDPDQWPLDQECL